MDLLLHDIAIAIERECELPTAGTWAWEHLQDVASAEPHEQRPRRSRDDQALPGVTR